MKKLLLFLLCLPLIAFGQGGQYGNSTDASELCDFIRGNNFATYRNADIALDKILDVTGMSKRYVIQECSDVDNCLATAYKGIRYILYNREFMDAIARRTNSWSNLSILAHEIGHHINGHSLDLVVYATSSAEVPTLSESRQMELEADEYAGFVMYKLGASLSNAQEAFRLLSTNDDDSYSTHPSRDKRLRAVEKGYNRAKDQDYSNDYSTTPTAEDYFYKAYNNESDYQYKTDNYTKAIAINPKFTQAYYNRGVSKNRLEDYYGAIADFTKAINIDPLFAPAFNNRAMLFKDLGMLDKALEDINNAINIDENQAQYYSNRARIYSENSESSDDVILLYAINDLTVAISLNPDNSYLFLERGMVRYRAIGWGASCNDFLTARKLGELLPPFITETLNEYGCN